VAPSIARLNRFQRWALLTTASTYLLIGIGGLVRAAGAGLGCPDWPQCFGSWIPPTSVAGVPEHIDPALFNVTKAWTEYLNRLTGVAVGFLIFGTLVLAFVHHRRTPRVLYATILAFVLVGFEGWIGGQVVRSELEPFVLTVHLVFALIVVSLLLYATVSAFFPPGHRITLSKPRLMLARFAMAVVLVTLVQIGLGALLRGEVQLVAEAGIERERWLAGIGWANIAHRTFAVANGAAVLGLAWWIFAKAEPDRWMRGLAVIVGAFVFAQAGAGLGIANLGFPPWLQVAHLWLSSLLLGALTLVVLLAYRLDPRERREVSIRSASVSEIDEPFSWATSSSENSSAVPTPRLVTTGPSTTTDSTSYAAPGS
jgi:cytochrome c oxidase assembly protein subunit 15